MPALSRRDFLNRLTALGLSAGTIPLLAGASALQSRSPLAALRPIRIRGRVHAGQKGWSGVGVTDGISVVQSDAEGTFELISNSRRPFVYLSLPSGSEIPVNPTGTARFYQPIQADRAGEMSVEFPLQRLNGSDEEHCFYQLADPQTENLRDMQLFQSQTVPEIEKLAAANPSGCQFGFTCGDIMFDDLELYPEYEKGVRQMSVPFFQVVGNHDLDRESPTNPGSSSTFQRHFGPAYYSFQRGAVHYVVLNDVFWYGKSYLAYLDKEQLDWLAADLARVESGRTVIVALHIPAFSSQAQRRGITASPRLTLNNREALYRLLEPYQAHIVSGHTHESEHVFEGGCHEHVCGPVCGAWWS
ncbi:MAG: metallophosphoesterase N-terminal domain-containing protein, partial [Acidobacteriota bacterium]